ncbi:hypothetical protein FN846DRAFT_910298 [Sphaerosporella brunnea]|uniref:Geranylgeranyl pyrophosphate synthetase n=1 Tax=Sphaerosporella brunnea TaxID=1250544 RepID=A0A5J5EMC1_9PEZI|nr:hypothetical protein FN846DRAFT_910298 [Sphaerosporella brunnea]
MSTRTKHALKGTTTLAAAITPSEIQHRPTCSVSQENVSVLTSYDLLPKYRRAIIVPGSPPVWSPPPLPITIPADKGLYSIDPTRLVFPTCPLEPVFRALEITAPHLKLSDFDVISDRRNLRLLYACAGGSTQAFRIDAETAGGKTLLLSVFTGRRVSYAKGTPACGYGMNFEKAFTKRLECSRGSTHHHRVIDYSLGGLRFMVRFEVDACIASKPMTRRYQKRTVTAPTGLKVYVRGALAKPGSIAELKTGRYEAGSLACSDNMAQLWFSQTPILFSGRYKGQGNFETVERKDVIAIGKMKRWEESHAEKLKKLVRLLEMLREAIMAAGDGKFAIVLEKGKPELKIFALDQERYRFGLPEDILAKWKC